MAVGTKEALSNIMTQVHSQAREIEMPRKRLGQGTGAERLLWTDSPDGPAEHLGTTRDWLGTGRQARKYPKLGEGDETRHLVQRLLPRVNSRGAWPTAVLRPPRCVMAVIWRTSPTKSWRTPLADRASTDECPESTDPGMGFGPILVGQPYHWGWDEIEIARPRPGGPLPPHWTSTVGGADYGTHNKRPGRSSCHITPSPTMVEIVPGRGRCINLLENICRSKYWFSRVLGRARRHKSLRKPS